MKNHQKCIKKTIKNLGARGIVFLQFFSLTLGNTLIFDAELFTGSLSGTQNSYSELNFNLSGNNFPGTIFWDTGLNLTQTHEIIFDGTSKNCNKQVKGTYYNATRGTRLRPLDQTSLSDLQTVDSSYNNLELTGGFFYNCVGEDFYQVFGQITHTYNGSDYKLIAGIEFDGNSYTNNYANTLEYLTPNGLISTGKIFDTYGGVATLQGSGNHDFEDPTVTLLSPDSGITIYENTTELERTGTDNFNISGFHYELARDIAFTSIVTGVDTTNTGITTIDLTDDIYYRRVSAEDFGENTKISTTRNFEISTSEYVQLPITNNTGDIFDAFIHENYQTGGGALNTVSDDTLVGYTGVDLNTNGEICPGVPVIFQSSGTQEGSILEMEINNCVVMKTVEGDNYSGLLSTPSFTGTTSTFELINQDTNTVVKIGPDEAINFETTGGASTSVTLRIPTPGVTIGETVQIYSSPDTDNRNFEGTTTTTNINGESYATFTTNHLTYFSLGTETGNFVINNDDINTETTGVTLNMSVSGATEMRFGNTEAARNAATRQTYTTTTGRYLTTDVGNKTVYAEFKNAEGETGTVNDSINHTSGAFTVTFTGDTPINGTITNNTTFHGEIEIIRSTLQKIIRTRQGSEYIFDMTGRWDDFGTGEYSLTDYTDTKLVLATNLDNISTLGENSTTVKDFSLSNNTGTVTNATQTSNGHLNNAFNFDGDNDYIDFGTDSSLDLGTSFTVSAWINPDTLKNYAGIISKAKSDRSGEPYSYMLIIDDDGTIGAYNGSDRLFSENANIKTDNRYYVTWVLSGGNMYYYVNGNSYGSNSFSYSEYTAYHIFAGSWYTNTAYDFNGIIDNIRIYKQAKSAEWIKQQYNNTITKYDNETRGLTNEKSDLDYGTYSYQACGEDATGLTGCTEERDFTVVDSTIDIYKTQDKDIYHALDYITYTIDFANNGNVTSTGVVIQELLLTGLDYISHTFTGPTSHTFESGLNSTGDLLLERSGFDLAAGASGQIILTAQIIKAFPLIPVNHQDITGDFINPAFREANPTSGEIIEKLYDEDSPYTQIRENYTNSTCTHNNSDIIEIFEGDNIPTPAANKIYLIHTGEYAISSALYLESCSAFVGIGEVEISTTTQTTNTIIVSNKENAIIDNIKVDGKKGHTSSANQYGIHIYQEASNNTINNVESQNNAYGISLHVFGNNDATNRYMKNNLVNKSIAYNNSYGIDIISAFYVYQKEGINSHNIINNCQTFNNAIGIRMSSIGTNGANESTAQVIYNTINNTQSYNNDKGVYLIGICTDRDSIEDTKYNTIHNSDIYNNNIGIKLEHNAQNGSVSNNNFSNLKVYNNTTGFQLIDTTNNEYYNDVFLHDNDINIDGNGLDAGGSTYTSNLGRTAGEIISGTNTISCDYINNPRNASGEDLHEAGINDLCNTRGIITSFDNGPLQGIKYGYYLTKQTQPIRYNSTTLEYYGTENIDYYNIFYNAEIKPLEWILNQVFMSGSISTGIYTLNTEYKETVDLRTTKSVTGDYTSGGTVEYTITYGNSGYDTDTITIVDIISGAWMSGINYAGTWTYSGDNVFYTGFSLAANSSGSIVLTAVINTGTEELETINTVTITGAYFDLNTGDNTDTENFTIPGSTASCPTSFTRNNDNFITQTGFRDNNPNDCDIMIALYGDSTGDTTAYSENWNEWDYSCNWNSGLTVEYIDAGNGNIPNVLSGNTIYVLQSGNHLIPYSTGTNMSGCTAIVGSGNVKLYSTGQIASDGMINNNGYYDFGIIDNMKINGSGDGAGSNHTKNKYGINIYNADNYSINNIETSEHGNHGIYTYLARYGTINNIIAYKNSIGIYMNYNSMDSNISNIKTYQNTNHGISFSRSDNATVENIESYNNTSYGVYVSSTDNVLIDNAQVFDNGGIGIYIIGSSFTSNNCSVSNSKSYNNGNHGIQFYNAHSGTLNNVEVYNNSNTSADTHGIVFDDAQNGIISGAKVYENKTNGIHLYNADGTKIYNSQSFKNKYGVYVYSTDNIELSNIQSYNNTSYGIYTYVSHNGTINNSQTYSNKLQGLLISASNNTVMNNNHIYNNDNDGVSITNSDNNFFHNTSIYNNSLYGLDIDSNSTNNKYYGTLEMFDNMDLNFHGTTANDTYLTGGLSTDTEIFTLGRTDGTISNTGCMSCDRYTNPQNSFGEFMMNTGNYEDCLRRGEISTRTGTSGTNNLYGQEISKQTTGVYYSGSDIEFSDLDFDTGKYIAEKNSLGTFTGDFVCRTCDRSSLWRENDNYINQTGFWDNNPDTCDIIAALYGTGQEDPTSYTENRDGLHNSCDYAHMKIKYVNSGVWLSGDTLDRYTIYVLSGDGNYIIPHDDGVDMNQCTAIVGNREIDMYSTGYIANTSDGIINSNSHEFNIVDNININGSGNGAGSTHSKNRNAIYVSNSDNNTINNVQISDNNIGIHERSSTDYRKIDNSSIYNNDGDGVYIDIQSRSGSINNSELYNNNGKGIEIYRGSNYNSINSCDIHNNQVGVYLNRDIISGSINNTEIHNNSSYGIQTNSADNINIENTKSHDNGSYGVQLYNSDNTTINNFESFNNSNDGINAQYSLNGTLQSGQIYNNTSNGIYIQSSPNRTIKDSKFFENSAHGSYATNSNNLTISNDQSYNNNYGIYLSNTDDVIINNLQTYNNTIGIQIASSDNVSLNNSQSYNNDNDGIYLSTSNTGVINNTHTYNNGRYGFIINNSDNWVFHNIHTYNNETYGLYTYNDATNNKYYGTLKLFDNMDSDFYGTTANDTYLTGGLNADTEVSSLGRTDGTLSTTGCMTCDRYTNPQNSFGVFLIDTGAYTRCFQRGSISTRTGTSGTNYLYAENIIKQRSGVYYSGTDIEYSNLTVNTGEYIAQTNSLGTSTNNEACRSCGESSIGWNNDNFITQTGFWDNNPDSCDIITALYGTGSSDPTAYSENWNGLNNHCSYTHMDIEYINSGTWNSGDTLNQYTIYVLSGDGNYLVPHDDGVDMNQCTAIVGNREIDMYSTGYIANTSDGIINGNSHEFNIVDNININGSGDGIGGTHTDNRHGVFFSNSDNGTLNNIEVSDSSQGGIYFSNTKNWLVNNIESFNNNQGIYLYSNSDTGIISNSKFHNNYNGIYIYQYSDNITLDNIKTSENTNYGIYIYRADNTTITGSQISNNNNAGIYLGDAENTHTFNSQLFNNGSYGIYFSANSHSGKVISSEIYNHTTYGIYANGVLNTVISGSQVYENGSHGISLSNADNATIDSTQTFNNNHGVYISSTDDYNINNLQTYDNTSNGVIIYSSDNGAINNSQIYNNNNHGISLSNSDYTTLNNINSYNNNNHGLDLYRSNSGTLNNSRFYNNGIFGIHIDAESTGTKYYGELKLFDNATLDLSGTTASDAQLTGGLSSDSEITNLGRSTGTLSTTGSMSCERYTNPQNSYGEFLMDTCTFIYCEGTGNISTWTGTSGTNYVYGSDLSKQETGVYYSGGTELNYSSLFYDPTKFIAEVNSLGEYNGSYACLLPTVRHISPLSGTVFEGTTVNLVWSGSAPDGLSGYYYQIYRRDDPSWTDILSGTRATTGLTLTGLQDATYKRQIKIEDVDGDQSDRHTGWTFEANKYTDITVSKTSDTDAYHKFDTITYSIDFANNGTTGATDIEVYDRLFSGLDYISHTFTGPETHTFSTGTNASGDLLMYRTGFDLDTGETGAIILTAQVINSFTPTLPGRGYNFDGVDDHVLSVYEEDLGYFHTGNFTITFRYYSDSTEGNNGIAGIRHHSPGRTSLIINGNKSTIGWILGYDAGGSASDATAVGINAQERNHISIVKSGLNVKIYTNGSQADSQNISAGALISDNNRLAIGRGYSYINTFNYSGSLSDFRIYNEALNSTAIYDISKHTYIGSPILRYKMDEGAGTTGYDSSGSGHDGSLVDINESTFHFADEELYSFQYNLGRTDGNGSNGADTGVYIPRNESTVGNNTGYDVLGNPLDYYQINQPFCLLGICNYVIADGVYAYSRADYASTTDLYITKTVTGDYSSGGVVEYTITYGNSGYDTAANIEITETPSTRLSGNNFAGTRTDEGNGTFTTSVGDLAIGATGSLIFTATVITGAEGGIILNNTVSITGYYYDINIEDNSYITGFETIDTTTPNIYFTGVTPASGTITSETTFTGQAETIEAHLSGLTRNRSGTIYELGMNILSKYYTNSGAYDIINTQINNSGIISTNVSGLALDVDFSNNELFGSTGNIFGDLSTDNTVCTGDGTTIEFGENLINQSNNFTVQWIGQLTSLSNGNKVFDLGRGPGQGSHLITYNSKLRFDITAGTTYSIYSNNTVQLGTTYTVQLVKRDGLVQMYLDGVLQNDTITISNISTQDIYYLAGTGNEAFTIYERALSTGELLAYPRTSIPKNTAGLRGFTTTHTRLTEGTYIYQACAEDEVGLTGCTETRELTVDLTDPTIYFTGNTPADGTITGNTFFHTGKVEIIEDNLETISRIRNETTYNFRVGTYNFLYAGINGTKNFETNIDENGRMSFTISGVKLAYDFDQDSQFGTNGDTIGDLSPNNYDGDSTATRTGSGKFNTGLYFGGYPDRVVFENIDFANNYTFSIRLKASSEVVGSLISGGPTNGRDSPIESGFYINWDNRASNRKITFYAGGSSFSTPTNSLPSNTVDNRGLLSISCSQTNNICEVYYNDENIGTGDYLNLTNLDTSTSYLAIRAYCSPATTQYEGSTDNFIIYDYALSSGEIEQLYNANITSSLSGSWNLTTTHTGLTDGTYTYQACAEDVANNTGCTETRNFTVDLTDPYIYFTGATPASGTISTNTTFTGEFNVEENHLQGVSRNRDGINHIFDMGNYRNTRLTGEYSWTDYSDTGLVLALNFDNKSEYNENSTTMYDFSSRHNTGTITNATLTPNGAFQSAYEFDGDNSFISLGDNLDDIFAGTNKTFSFSARIKPGTSTLHNSAIIAKSADSACSENQRQFTRRILDQKMSFLWYGNLGNTPTVYYSVGGAREITNTNKRYQIIMTYDGSQSYANRTKMYLNGEVDATHLRSSSGSPDAIPNGTAHLGIGSAVKSNGTNCSINYAFDGEIDDVRIYDYVLSAEEVESLYSPPILNIINQETGVQSFEVIHENLTDGTYEYQTCAEDILGNTGCTDTGSRTYTVQTPKTITTKTAKQYTTTGDFWLFEQTGATSRRQVFNSAKISTDNIANIHFGTNNSSGQIIITGELFPTSGATYLAVFKLSGALAVGYTGIWTNDITGFNFSNNSITNLYPKLTYEDTNYLYIGDVDTSSSGAYDLIYGPDLALQNTQLTKNTLNPLKPIYDFDYNEVATALEQAMILYNLDIGGYIQDNLPGGLEITDFENF